MSTNVDSIRFDKIIQMMIVKNNLIIADIDDLINMYKDADDEKLEMLLEGIILNFTYDQAFFYLRDGLIKKVNDLVIFLRENCDKKYINNINDIIVNINQLKFKDELVKREELQEYIDRQEYFRNAQMDNEQLLSSLCYDALVVQGIGYNNLCEIEEKDYVLASLNYLIQICPKHFLDETNNQIVTKELEDISKIKGYTRELKRYIKDTKRLFKNINKEG